MGKAYGYVRVSRMRDEDKVSPQAQKMVIEAEADRRGLELVKHFEDLDINSARIERNGTWTEIFDTLQAGDTLLVNDSSRLGRDVLDIIQRVHRGLVEREIHLFAPDLPFEITTPDGKHWLVGKANDNELDNAKRGLKIKQAHGELLKAGRWHGGPAPYGYRYEYYEQRVNKNGETVMRGHGKLMIHEPEAAVVRRIFELRTRGNGYRVIAKETGLTPYFITCVIGRRSYIAEREKDGEVYPLDIPPIVDMETWNKVRAIEVWGNGNGHGRNRYLLSGLLRCTCGAKLVRHPCRGRYNYICSYGNNFGGGRHVTISEPKAEAWILGAFFPHVKSLGLEAEVAKAQARLADANKDTASVREALAAAEAKLDRLLALHLDGRLDDGQWTRQKEPLEAEAHRLREKISKAEINQVLILKWDGDVERDWGLLTLDEKRHALRLFIDKVAVRPGREDNRIEIDWRE